MLKLSKGVFYEQTLPKQWDEIAHPCFNINSGLVKSLLKIWMDE